MANAQAAASSPLGFLPVDLYRWDRDPGGDVLVVPLWSDIRPLRGAAGLLDWRLCGRISKMIREGRVSGAVGEKLLLATARVPWKKILAVGVGDSHGFVEKTFRETVASFLEALKGLAPNTLAIALPGRDMDLIRPDRAIKDLVDLLVSHRDNSGLHIARITVIDTPAAAKAVADAARGLAHRLASPA